MEHGREERGLTPEFLAEVTVVTEMGKHREGGGGAALDSEEFNHVSSCMSGIPVTSEPRDQTR